MTSYVKTIGLIRHGETDWNTGRRMQGQEDIPLNKRGQQQSIELGQFISGLELPWDIIVSSPLQRALDTAQTISPFIGSKEIIILNQFMERDFGQAAGLTREETREQFPQGIIPGLETSEDLTARIISGLDYLFSTVDQDRILLVTHGEVMRTIYKLMGQDHKVSLKPGNASIDVIRFDRCWLTQGQK